MLFTFVATLIVYSLNMVHENYWCSSSIACQKKKKKQIGYLEYSPLMIKIHNFGTSVFLRVKVIKE